MIDWAAVHPKLKDWIKAGTGISQVAVVDEKREFNDPTFVEYRVTNVSSNGYVDNVQLVDVETSPGVFAERWNIRGQRSFSLEIAVWSDVQVAPKFSHIPLETLRTVSQVPRLIDILALANVAKAGFGDCAAGDIERDGRMWSVWLATAEFNAGFNWTGTALDAGDSIEQVTGASAFPVGSTERPFTAP